MQRDEGHVMNAFLRCMSTVCFPSRCAPSRDDSKSKSAASNSDDIELKLHTSMKQPDSLVHKSPAKLALVRGSRLKGEVRSRSDEESTGSVRTGRLNGVVVADLDCPDVYGSFDRTAIRVTALTGQSSLVSQTMFGDADANKANRHLHNCVHLSTTASPQVCVFGDDDNVPQVPCST